MGSREGVSRKTEAGGRSGRALGITIERSCAEVQSAADDPPLGPPLLVGGVVNMKTKSALTRKGRHLTTPVGEAYNVWRGTFRPFASITYSDVLGAEQKFGLLVTASYNQTNKPRDNSNFAYEATTDTNRPIWFKSTGLVSFGAFRKDLRDFIFASGSPITLQSGNPYGEDYVGHNLSTSVNGGKAWVRGLEFAYQQQLSDLKVSFLRPFGLFANFTWLQTQGNDTSATGVSSSSAVPGFTPRSGNVGVSWIAYGWTVRVKAKYESDRLRVYNANPANRICINDNCPIDLNVAYTINRRLSAFLDVINVFDARTFDDYQYIEERPLRTFKFSTYIKGRHQRPVLAQMK